MNIKNIATYFGIASALVTGYSSASTPTCSDENVQKTIINIAEGKMRDLLVPFSFPPDSPALIGPHSYNDIVKIQDQDPLLKKVIENVDEAMTKLPLSLSGIRVNSVDKEIMKIECAANLTQGEKQGQITYSAQYTEDGQLYVEVSGL